jgi:hypothetical protein
MAGAWAVAAPFDGTPDEHAHILRAYGVASGDITPPLIRDARGSGALQQVPAGLIRENCWKFEPTVSVSCAVPPGTSTREVEFNVLAGRYNPTYYAFVGWPLKIWPGMGGVVGARLISSLGVAALLASAFTLLFGLRRRLFLGAFLVACTPMVLHIGGAVNPNGWEISAGFAFFAAGLRLFLHREERDPRFALWVLGISGSLLLVLRTAGLLLFGVALLSLILPLKFSTPKELWQRRSLRPIYYVWGAVTLFAVLWTLIMKPNQLGTANAGFNIPLYEATYTEIIRWGNYLNEFIGVMSHLDTRVPETFYIIWQVLAGFLIILTLLTAKRLGLSRILVVIAGGALLPSLMQIAFINQAGFVAQGRYMLPLMVGIPLLCAYLLEENQVLGRHSIKLVRTFILVLLPLHVYFLGYTMIRWQRGGVGYNPFEGTWLPNSGPYLPVAMSMLGVGLLGLLVWVLTRTPKSPAGSPRLALQEEIPSVQLPAGDPSLANAR